MENNKTTYGINKINALPSGKPKKECQDIRIAQMSDRQNQGNHKSDGEHRQQQKQRI